MLPSYPLDNPNRPAYPFFKLSMLLMTNDEVLMAFHVFLLLSLLLLYLAWLGRLSLLHRGLAHRRVGKVHPVFHR